MAAVQVLVAEPGRHRPGGDEIRLAADPRDPGVAQVTDDRRRTGVAVPERGPYLAAHQAVATERLLVALPHQHRRVVRPAVVRPGERADDLDHLDPLLAETFGVEHPRGALEVGVREEGLHAPQRAPHAWVTTLTRPRNRARPAAPRAVGP